MRHDETRIREAAAMRRLGLEEVARRLEVSPLLVGGGGDGTGTQPACCDCRCRVWPWPRPDLPPKPQP